MSKSVNGVKERLDDLEGAVELILERLDVLNAKIESTKIKAEGTAERMDNGFGILFSTITPWIARPWWRRFLGMRPKKMSLENIIKGV